MTKVEAARAYGAQVELAGEGFDESLAAALPFAERTGAAVRACVRRPARDRRAGHDRPRAAGPAARRRDVRGPGRRGWARGGDLAGAREDASPASCGSVGVQAQPGFTIADGITVKHPGKLTCRSSTRRSTTSFASTTTRSARRSSSASSARSSSSRVPARPRSPLCSPGEPVATGPSAPCSPAATSTRPCSSPSMRHGLTGAGRYLVLRTLIPDRPGELTKLLDLIARSRGNVVAVEHHREGMQRQVMQTEVELTLVTRDEAHRERDPRRPRRARVSPWSASARSSSSRDAGLPALRQGEPGRRSLLRGSAARALATPSCARSGRSSPSSSPTSSARPPSGAARSGGRSRAPRAATTPALRRELERFGGTVEKFIGDAVVGVFGAPTAHEDDPERAVRAALAIQDAIAELNEADPALDLQVRVGINTGEALVALDAPAGQGRGHGLGRRDEHRGPPAGRGAARTACSSARRPTAPTERVIDYRAHAAGRGEGQAEPVAAWVAVAPRASFGIDLSETSRGAARRPRPRARPARGALAACARPDPQLVTLVGVPGIGKSRLVRGALPPRRGGRRAHLLAARPLASRTAKASRTGRSARWSRPRPGSSSRTTGGRGDKLDRAVAGPRSLDGDQVGLAASSPPASRRARVRRTRVGAIASEVFAAWRRLIEAIARSSGRRVFVFEDLQWADDGMLDFVDELVDWITGVPLLVVASARPELLERRPGWGGGKRNAAHDLAVAAVRRGHRAPPRRPPRPSGASRGDAERSARATPAATRCSRRSSSACWPAATARRRRSGVAAGARRCAGRRVAARREDSCSRRGSVLGKVFWTDALASARGRVAGGRSADAAAARAQGVPASRAPLGRCRRRAVHLRARARARRRVRADARAPSGPPPPPRRRLDRVAAARPVGRSCRDARAPPHRALEYDRAGGRGRRPSSRREPRPPPARPASVPGRWARMPPRFVTSVLRSSCGGDDADASAGVSAASSSAGAMEQARTSSQRSVAGFLAAGDSAGAAEAEAELALFHRRRGSGDVAARSTSSGRSTSSPMFHPRGRAARCSRSPRGSTSSPDVGQEGTSAGGGGSADRSRSSRSTRSAPGR